MILLGMFGGGDGIMISGGVGVIKKGLFIKKELFCRFVGLFIGIKLFV